jgi:hypothetical protein
MSLCYSIEIVVTATRRLASELWMTDNAANRKGRLLCR